MTAIKSYVKVWVCYETLQRTTSKKVNIQAPEGIGYQSLTKTKTTFQKKKKEKNPRRINYHRPKVLLLVEFPQPPPFERKLILFFSVGVWFPAALPGLLSILGRRSKRLSRVRLWLLFLV